MLTLWVDDLRTDRAARVGHLSPSCGLWSVTDIHVWEHVHLSPPDTTDHNLYVWPHACNVNVNCNIFCFIEQGGDFCHSFKRIYKSPVEHWSCVTHVRSENMLN